jgi:hypothetical protein
MKTATDTITNVHMVLEFVLSVMGDSFNLVSASNPLREGGEVGRSGVLQYG